MNKRRKTTYRLHRLLADIRNDKCADQQKSDHRRKKVLLTDLAELSESPGEALCVARPGEVTDEELVTSRHDV